MKLNTAMTLSLSIVAVYATNFPAQTEIDIDSR